MCSDHHFILHFDVQILGFVKSSVRFMDFTASWLRYVFCELHGLACMVITINSCISSSLSKTLSISSGILSTFSMESIALSTIVAFGFAQQ